MARRVAPATVIAFMEKALNDALAGGHDKNVYHNSLPQLRALLRLLDDLPETFWPTGEHEGTFLVAWEEIKSQVIRWEAQGSGIGALPGGQSGNAVWRLYSTLLNAPRNVVPDDVPGLEFISDPEFRTRLREDIAAAELSFTDSQIQSSDCPCR